MADPTIQTFCCHYAGNHTDMAVKVMSEFNTASYNAVCITSSSIGILGALYQILPREESIENKWHPLSPTRGRQIVIWLAIADLLASLGVLVRSAIWMSYRSIMPSEDDHTSVLFCAVTSAWIQYFYTVTWMWTLCYACDTRLVLSGRECPSRVYHTLSWGVPAALTSIGLSLLYLPDANCHSTRSLHEALLRVLPNYCITYIPIAVVMILNPIFFRMATSGIETAVSMPLAQYTSKERRLVDALKLKFCFINVVFYICWLPNLINGILIWVLWFRLPVNTVISLWYVMAVVNPLQALFNSLVYRRWVGYGVRGEQRLALPSLFRSCRSNSKYISPKYSPSSMRETTPLLSSDPPPRLHLTSHPTNSINGVDTL